MSRERVSLEASVSEPSREVGSIDRAPAREERTGRCAQGTRRSGRAERAVRGAHEAGQSSREREQ